MDMVTVMAMVMVIKSENARRREGLSEPRFSQDEEDSQDYKKNLCKSVKSVLSVCRIFVNHKSSIVNRKS
jgi:hypothetical protein